MTSETFLDLTFERSSKSMSGSAGGGSSGTSRLEVGGSSNVSATGAAIGLGGGSEKRPIRPKLLKLSDVTIPHRNRKKTKTKVSLSVCLCGCLPVDLSNVNIF